MKNNINRLRFYYHLSTIIVLMIAIAALMLYNVVPCNIRLEELSANDELYLIKKKAAGIARFYAVESEQADAIIEDSIISVWGNPWIFRIKATCVAVDTGKRNTHSFTEILWMNLLKNCGFWLCVVLTLTILSEYYARKTREYITVS